VQQNQDEIVEKYRTTKLKIPLCFHECKKRNDSYFDIETYRVTLKILSIPIRCIMEYTSVHLIESSFL